MRMNVDQSRQQLAPAPVLIPRFLLQLSRRHKLSDLSILHDDQSVDHTCRGYDFIAAYFHEFSPFRLVQLLTEL